MTPLPTTEIWYESDGAFLTDDLELSNLMLRVGIAVNALGAQLEMVRNALDKSEATQMLVTHSAMIASASLTFEALRLARRHMPVFRRLAENMDGGPVLLEAMGKLMAGKHAASATLDRARNQLGFHWDAEVIEPAIKAYARNRSVIWLELAKEEIVYHRLADEVLVYSFLSGTLPADSTPRALRAAVEHALTPLMEAMRTVEHFFAACFHGYIESQRGKIRRHTKVDGEGDS